LSEFESEYESSSSIAWLQQPINEVSESYWTW